MIKHNVGITKNIIPNIDTIQFIAEKKIPAKEMHIIIANISLKSIFMI